MCYGHIGGYGLLLFDFLYGKISNVRPIWVNIY